MKRFGVAVAAALLAGGVSAQEANYVEANAQNWVDPLTYYYTIECTSQKFERDGDTMLPRGTHTNRWEEIDYASWVVMWDFIARGQAEVIRAWVEEAVEEDPEGAGFIGADLIGP